ncbi:MAG: sigma-70 family RNA polymerase sigma factor [Planctomycetota bacterium]
MNSAENKSANPLEAGFMRLFLRHEMELRAYARTILPDWESVEDALQEASVTMWQKLGQLESDDGFLPWAKVIVRFKCLQSIERLRKVRPLLSDEVLTLLADEAAQTETVFEVRQKALANCLSEFSKAHRELLMAPYASDGRVKELASSAGKTDNAFYKLLARLRQKLTKCVRARLQAEIA